MGGNIIGELGPWLALIVIGGFTFLMILRGPWKWPPVLMGMLLLAVLYGHYPSLPATLNNAATSIVHDFGG